MKVRCSALDRVMTCPASIHGEPGEVEIDHEAGAAATVGTAVHDVLRDVVSNRWTRLPDIGPYCVNAGCSDDREVRIFGYCGMKFLAEYRAFLSEHPLVEVGRTITTPGGVGLTGRADILDYVEVDGRGTVYVIDWKTGMYDEDSRYRHQMLGYAAIGLKEFEAREVKEVIVILAWLRSMEATVMRYRPEEITAFLGDLDYVVNTRAEKPRYTPGSACQYCPRVAVCPGRTAMMQNAVEVLTGGGMGVVPVGGQLVDADGFARSILQARMLKTLCEDHLRNCVEAVRSLGGEVPLPDGGKVTLVSRAGRPKLHPEKVIPALRGQFGEITDEELFDMVSLSKGAVESYITSKADQGEKKALKEAVLSTLEETGAMTRGAPVEYVQVKEA